MASILIIEDETLLGRSLAASLAQDGHRSHWVSSAEDASSWLSNHQADLALIDCGLPGMSGMDLLAQLVEAHPDTGVIMMTAHGDVPTAVSAMKLGAMEFLIKPVDLEVVSLIAHKSLKHRRMERTWEHERKQRSQQYGLHQVIGRCAGIEKAKTLVRRIASINVAASERLPNVLITGETGTGKDVFARAIHYEGTRQSGPFVHVNCAALPESLIESELFGHVKGAFTDARSSKRGLFEVADHGTLFLDEVGTLPLALQAKILTVIETGSIRPVGGADEISVNVHLVAAMNHDPARLVAEGRFRADLYHRLRVIHIELPPLRSRGADVDLLAEHFLRKNTRKFSMPAKKLTDAARRALRKYRWPGNVRELSHCLESAVLLCGEDVDVDSMPVLRDRGNSSQPVKPVDSIGLDFSKGPIPLEQVERTVIARAMAETQNNISRAARLLDLSRDAMRYRLEKHGFQTQRNGIKQR